MPPATWSWWRSTPSSTWSRRTRTSRRSPMPRSTPDPTLVTPEVLRGWQLPEPTGGKNARGSILVIGGSTETLGAALPEADGGGIAADAADVVRDLAESADAVLIGPGMADTEATRAFGEKLLPHLRGPLALDARGLAAVTADAGCVQHLDGRVVLTPNPTEIAYALHVEEDEIAD